MDDAQLRTVWQQRQYNDRFAHLSQPLAFLMKHHFQKRVRQLGQLAKIWDDIVPESINDHTALESLNAGVLTVMVDSAAHRFQLHSLLEGGLRRQIQERFPGAINKVKLVPGQFCSVDVSGNQRYDL